MTVDDVVNTVMAWRVRCQEAETAAREMAAERTRLTAERDALVKERDALTAERDALVKEMQAVATLRESPHLQSVG